MTIDGVDYAIRPLAALAPADRARFGELLHRAGVIDNLLGEARDPRNAAPLAGEMDRVVADFLRLRLPTLAEATLDLLGWERRMQLADAIKTAH